MSALLGGFGLGRLLPTKYIASRGAGNKAGPLSDLLLRVKEAEPSSDAAQQALLWGEESETSALRAKLDEIWNSIMTVSWEEETPGLLRRPSLRVDEPGTTEEPASPKTSRVAPAVAEASPASPEDLDIVKQKLTAFICFVTGKGVSQRGLASGEKTPDKARDAEPLKLSNSQEETSPQILLQKMYETAVSVLKEEAAAVEKQILELHDRRQPLRLAFQEEAIAFAGHWLELRRRLVTVAASPVCGGEIGESLLANMRAKLPDRLKRMQALLIARQYCRSLYDCLEILTQARRQLAQQQYHLCRASLSGLCDILLRKAQRDGRWLLEEGSRSLLAQRLEFLVEALVVSLSAALFQRLETAAWGTPAFKTAPIESTARESISRILSALCECERNVVIVEALKTGSSLPDMLKSHEKAPTSLYGHNPRVAWSSGILAALAIARFRFLTSLPSDNLKAERKYTARPIEQGPTIAAPWLAKVVAGFCDFVAASLGHFVLERCNLILSHEFAIAAEDEGETFKHTVFPPHSETVEAIATEWLDHLAVYTDDIAALSPTSVQYVFVPPAAFFWLQEGESPGSLEIFSAAKLFRASYSFSGEKFVSAAERYPEDTRMVGAQERAPSTGNAARTLEDIAAAGASSIIQLLGVVDFQRASRFLHLSPSAVLQPAFLAKKETRETSVWEGALRPRKPSLDITTPNDEINPSTRSRTFRVSAAVETLIAVVQVLESRISSLATAESACSETHEALQIYAGTVTQPLFQRLRLSLRDNWNSLAPTTLQVSKRGLILDSFQLGFDFLRSNGFPTCRWLREVSRYHLQECDEWRRMWQLTYKVLEGLITPVVQSGIEQMHLTSSPPEDFADMVLEPLKAVVAYVTLDASRALLLNSLLLSAISAIFRSLEVDITLLSTEQRETLVRNAHRLKELIESRDFVTLAPDLVTELAQLNDLIHLLELPALPLIPTLRQLDDLITHFQKLKAAAAHERRPGSSSAFVGIKLVMEAENIFKSLASVASKPVRSETDILSSEAQAALDAATRIAREELGVAELSGLQCFSILRKRREFCFTTSYQPC